MCTHQYLYSHNKDSLRNFKVFLIYRKLIQESSTGEIKS